MVKLDFTSHSLCVISVFSLHMQMRWCDLINHIFINLRGHFDNMFVYMQMYLLDCSQTQMTRRTLVLTKGKTKDCHGNIHDS